jgi:hypothetical protein
MATPIVLRVLSVPNSVVEYTADGDELLSAALLVRFE